MKKTGVLKPELDLIDLIDQTQRHVYRNRDRYTQTATEVIERFYQLLFSKHLSVIGINHRLKSPDSLKEKIIRKKLYKKCSTPGEVVKNLPDLIGIMIECEFISDEKRIFESIKKTFAESDDGILFYSRRFPNLLINLGVPQPVLQKNGNELYKMDCCYLKDGEKINFELQIKSLVNSFWCEVEHNIIYKNNYYISSDDYVSEMLAAVRINLSGLDRILELIHNRISALTAYDVVKDLRLDSNLTNQLVSDLINRKMIESVGFTVEAKRIRDLLSWYILRPPKGRGEEDADLDFYNLSERFKHLHQLNFRFDRKIGFGDFYSDDIFIQTVGGKLIRLMDTDFEWHTFFVMLFQICANQKEQGFRRFMEVLRQMYCDGAHFDGLFSRLPAEDARTVCDEARMFVAEALCRLADRGILPLPDYRKGLEDVGGFLQYTLNCLDGMTEWVQKRSAVRAVIEKSICAAV